MAEKFLDAALAAHHRPLVGAGHQPTEVCRRSKADTKSHATGPLTEGNVDVHALLRRLIAEAAHIDGKIPPLERTAHAYIEVPPPALARVVHSQHEDVTRRRRRRWR